MLRVIQFGGAVDPSLQDLELRRKSLFRQLENPGDFRRGAISLNYRKCGKEQLPLCSCSRYRVCPGRARSSRATGSRDNRRPLKARKIRACGEVGVSIV